MSCGQAPLSHLAASLRRVAAHRTFQHSTVIAGETVEVRRSTRRRRSVQAYRDGERIVVLLPAALSAREGEEWTRKMVDRVRAQEARRRDSTPRSDEALQKRAAELSAAHLDGKAVPAAIRWVTNQSTRWGSCTPSTGQIRLSHRLQEMPAWVIDYVIVHELAHLLEASHGPRFQRLVDRYPHVAKAQGFLEGVSFATGRPASWPDDDGTGA